MSIKMSFSELVSSMISAYAYLVAPEEVSLHD
jgi:hypothetical protein